MYQQSSERGGIIFKMRHHQYNSKALMFLCFVILLCASPSPAEDVIKQFSLGGSTLTDGPSDAKAPEPGVVTAKYGFVIAKDFIPYLGTGLAYRYQPDTKTGDMMSFQTGVAAQVGFSYLLDVNSTLKLDYKYLSLSPEPSRHDSQTTPQSIGIGIDVKF